MQKHYMNYTEISKKILLPEVNKSLSLKSKWNCSEVSRLLAMELFDENIPELYILKGKVTLNGLQKENWHDILMFKYNNKYQLIDPTIWQFCPKRKVVDQGIFKYKKLALNFCNQFYGSNNWKISEKITEKYSENEIIEMKNIIKINITQAPNWDN